MAKVRADLHNHLRTSSRSSEPDFNRTIDTAAERLGNGAVVGVINFADKRYEHFTGLGGYGRVYVGEKNNGVYVPSKNVLIIKGQEVPTKEGHILVLGLGKDVHLKSGRNLQDSLSEARDNEGIIIADHPFYAYGIGSHLEANPSILQYFDAIEVHNGEAVFGIPKTPFPYKANIRAQEFYDRIKRDFPHLGALSSSDGHSIYELGRSWTEIDSLDLEDKTNFTPSLRDSIRKTNSQTPKKKSKAVLGALDHIADLILINQIGFRIGLHDFYCGTDSHN